jgi:subfamily B ATP-binding cassette protein HlyB/CyaB
MATERDFTLSASNDPGSVESLPEPEPEVSSLLQCLVIVARDRGVELSVQSALRGQLLAPGSIGKEQIVQIARGAGLRASITRLSASDFSRLGPTLPVIVLLRNGEAMVLVRVVGPPDGLELSLQDPKGASDALLVVDGTRLLEASSGEVILVKRDYVDAEELRPFGWGLIWAELTRDRPLVRDVAITAFLVGLLALAPIIFWRLLIDTVVYYRTLSTLSVLCLSMLMLIGFETAFGFMRRYLILHLSRRIEVNLATHIFSRLLRLPMEYFESSTAGELARDVNETWKIRQFVSQSVLGTALDGLVILVILPILFFFSPFLTSIVLVIAALVCGWLVLSMPAARRRATLTRAADGAVGAFLVETLFGMRTVKSLALDSRKEKGWDVLVSKAARLRLEEGQTVNLIQTVVLPLERFMTTGVFALAVYEVVTSGDQVPVGALMAFMMLTMRLVAPLSNLALLIPAYDEARLAVQMIAKMVNQRPEQGRGRGARGVITGRIEFDKVRFRYPSAESYALDEVSFTVPEGTIFGIVGRSGSGKTTVTRLLQMLHANYTGQIKIDDYELRSIDVDHLRSNVSTVLQENFLFRGTVSDSIAEAKAGATFEQIREAARLAGAEEFIERMPQGYETWIQEGSPNLSGGQRQRLAIARALITMPRILILDEATSSLDAESEAIINGNLQRIAKGRTLIVISHRLSSLIHADATMVLENGRVVALAKHDILLQDCDIYRSLWNQQHRHDQPSTPNEPIDIQTRIRAR